MLSELLLLLLLGCVASPQGDTGTLADAGTACNGSDDLCSRSLDQVTFPGTHNSMSNADAGWLIPNQQHGLTQQLQDGVRAMMLDVHDLDGEPTLCHSLCELGSQPLDEGLGELQTFLDAHPREVLLIIVEDHVSAEAFVAVAEQVGIADRAIVPPGGAWPSLQEFIDTDKRVLITAEGGGGEADWYVGAWEVFFDTSYSWESVEEMTCDLNRGDGASPLFLVNHWVSDPISTEDNAVQANAFDVLDGRARDCAAQWGRPVTYLAVDHYAVGDLFMVAAGLNAQ